MYLLNLCDAYRDIDHYVDPQKPSDDYKNYNAEINGRVLVNEINIENEQKKRNRLCESIYQG